MSKTIYIAIDVGCHECGVASEAVGAFADLDAAELAADERNAQTGRWRDGGQTIAQVFAVTAPA